MAQSDLLKSLHYNLNLVTKPRIDTLPQSATGYTYDKSDAPLQNALEFVPGIQGKDVPARLRTFLYGDSSLHGSGYWNKIPKEIPSVLQAIAAAEKCRISMLAPFPALN